MKGNAGAAAEAPLACPDNKLFKRDGLGVKDLATSGAEMELDGDVAERREKKEEDNGGEEGMLGLLELVATEEEDVEWASANKWLTEDRTVCSV